MKVEDIGKIQWERGNEQEKWYNTELCCQALSETSNSLLRLFTKKGFDTVVLNDEWFWGEKGHENWVGAVFKNLRTRGVEFFMQIISEKEKCIRAAELIFQRVQRSKKIDPALMQEVKRGFMFLWFVFNVDIGQYTGLFLEQKFKARRLTTEEVEQLKDHYFTSKRPLAFDKVGEGLREISALYKKKYDAKKFSLKNLPRPIKALLLLHQQKFQWLSYTDLNSEPLSLQDCYKDLLVLLSSRQTTKQKRSLPEAVKKRLAKRELKFLELVNTDLYLDNFAADLYQRSDFPIMRYLATKFSINFRDLTWYTFEELEELLAKGEKLSRTQLRERKKFRVMVQLNGELACFYGKRYFRKIRSLISIKGGETPEGIQEISGLVASPGIMRGRVKIVKEKKDMNRILPGDILVATTTRPELMPAIRRCAAIITDAGGITSHAAIVSREFKIPCIVNTKIATQVLKDGDMVEVNANKGIVKIL